MQKKHLKVITYSKSEEITAVSYSLEVGKKKIDGEILKSKRKKKMAGKTIVSKGPCKARNCALSCMERRHFRGGGRRNNTPLGDKVPKKQEKGGEDMVRMPTLHRDAEKRHEPVFWSRREKKKKMQ